MKIFSMVVIQEMQKRSFLQKSLTPAKNIYSPATSSNIVLLPTLLFFSDIFTFFLLVSISFITFGGTINKTLFCYISCEKKHSRNWNINKCLLILYSNASNI